MTSQLVPYERNTYLERSASNLTFQQLRAFGEDEFRGWAEQFRKDVVHAWDSMGVPVIGGRPADEIVRDFQRLADLDTTGFLRLDEDTNEPVCMVNPGSAGSTCNQFFPTILKTKDISTADLTGRSIYDYFAAPGLLEAFVSAARQLVDADPQGEYSTLISDSQSAVEWIDGFVASESDGFWLASVKKPRAGKLNLSREQVSELLSQGSASAEHVKGNGPFYVLRRYNPSKRLSDHLRAFRRISGGPPATNFPPAVAKYLYLRYANLRDKTEPESKGMPFVIYDSSSGWGGRILGALACGAERQCHYIGTDPNSDHWMPDVGMTKYEYLAQYFNGNSQTKFKTTHHLFRLGSETIHQDREFQKYGGKVDFAFTSPPYFAAEGYSDEETQSHMKFRTYEEWRDGFLRPTLETSASWLRENRYLCLNISDIRLDGKVLPLRSDAKDILVSLGFAQHRDLKMVLKDAGGGMKTNANDIPTIRHFCQVDGKKRKYEPILVFQKLYGHDDEGSAFQEKMIELGVNPLVFK